MAKVTIDGKEYDLEKLSENAKGNIASIRLADQKLAQLQSEIAMIQTARNAYAQSLAAELAKLEEGDKSEKTNGKSRSKKKQ